jgi:hypothetical protein
MTKCKCKFIEFGFFHPKMRSAVTPIEGCSKCLEQRLALYEKWYWELASEKV